MANHTFDQFNALGASIKGIGALPSRNPNASIMFVPPNSGDARNDDLRIEALRMAVQHMNVTSPVDTAICAEVFFDFLMGKSRKTTE